MTSKPVDETSSEPRSDGESEADVIESTPRKFRPDVEGLRALAILLVVLYHADVPGVRGGFVGVDVFFVISGFLITGLLVREADASGRVSLPKFYARRCRRILPAATVLVIFTVLASYHWLGFLMGNSVADDAKWATVFLANIHFADLGTQYFSSQAPPSPLQHMWSLSVEEQFYFVWPVLVLVVAAVARSVSLRLRLGIVLGVITVASFVWSVVQTSHNGVWAYFSPFTRAWELAIGGLLAIAAPLVSRLPSKWAWVMGYLGLGGIILSAVLYSAQTPYPGSAVALPVMGAVLIIGAGSALGGPGVERVLAPRPVQWLGARSYSWYLWHWPLLVIPAEYAGKSLSVWQNLFWVLLALVAAMVSYRAIERPIRGSRGLRARPLLSIAMGACLLVASLAVAQRSLQAHSGANGLGPPSVNVHTPTPQAMVGGAGNLQTVTATAKWAVQPRNGT
jgi:peptidoglycan/LPS O-acetylase OafA/YrhL